MKNMSVRLLFIVVVMAMISTIGGTSVFAHATTDPRPSGEETKASSETTSSAKERVRENAKLKGDLQKLLADAKAGKVAPRAQQSPNAGRHNLGTTAKIGIAVAIAGIIVAIIAIHTANND